MSDRGFTKATNGAWGHSVKSGKLVTTCVPAQVFTELKKRAVEEKTSLRSLLRRYIERGLKDDLLRSELGPRLAHAARRDDGDDHGV